MTMLLSPHYNFFLPFFVLDLRFCKSPPSFIFWAEKIDQRGRRAKKRQRPPPRRVGRFLRGFSYLTCAFVSFGSSPVRAADPKCRGCAAVGKPRLVSRTLPRSPLMNDAKKPALRHSSGVLLSNASQRPTGKTKRRANRTAQSQGKIASDAFLSRFKAFLSLERPFRRFFIIGRF